MMSNVMRRELISTDRALKRQIHSRPLADPTVLGALASFRMLVQSAYGPSSRLKFLQTALGGHVTVTSSSSTILHHLMSVCHPVVRLVILAVNGHLDVYGDGGLVTSLLAVRLIESSLELDIPRQVAVEVNSYALDVLTRYMPSDGCPWRMKLDIGDMNSMLCFVKSVVNTKSACRLSSADLEHICTILLKAFLQSLPSSPPPEHTQRWRQTPVQFLRCEGSPPLDTRAIQGVFLEAPSLPTHSQQQQSLVKDSVHHKGPLKVALYNVSMAADTDEWLGDVITVARDGMDAGLEGGVLRQIMDVAMALVLAGVGLVACQKCVHPAIKRFLKQKGMLVIDRLSVLHIDAVRCLTGATILSTFTWDIPSHWYGELQSIEPTVIGNKSYLHLLPSPAAVDAVSTIILCSPDESTLDELYAVCQSAIGALRRTLTSPYVVPGGGCLDTHLAWFLRHHAWQCKKKCLEDLGCSNAQFLAVMNNVARCLEGLASGLEHDGGGHIIDTTTHHHWSIPPGTEPCHTQATTCMCRLVSRKGGDFEWCSMGEEVVESLINQQSKQKGIGNVGQEKRHCEQLRNAREFVRQEANVEHEERGTTQEGTFDNVVIDSLAMRQNSFRTAFETANVILRVNCLVTDE